MPFAQLHTLYCAYFKKYLVTIWEQNQTPSWDLMDPIFTFADVFLHSICDV